MSDTIAIVSRLSPQTIKTIHGATIDVFAALSWRRQNSTRVADQDVRRDHMVQNRQRQEKVRRKLLHCGRLLHQKGLTSS